MSVYPDIEVGDIVTADLLTSMLPIYIVKSANETVTSSTTLQTDDELVTPTLAVGVWSIRGSFVMSTVTAVKIAWISTGTIVGNRRCMGPGSSATTAEDNSTIRWPSSGITTANVYGYRSGTLQYHILEFGIFTVSVAGTLAVQWAQNVSSGTATTMHSTSHLEIKRVS